MLSVDTSILLRRAPDIDAEVRKHRMEEDIVRFQRVLRGKGPWSRSLTPRPTWARTRLGAALWWTYQIVAAVILTTGIPMGIRVVGWVGTQHTAKEYAVSIAQLATLALFLVTGITVWAYSIVTFLIDRQFFMAAAITLMSGSLSVAGICGAVLAWSHPPTWGQLIRAVLSILSAYAVPLLLVGKALRSSRIASLVWPGAGLRWLIRRSIVLKWATFKRELAHGAQSTRPRKRPSRPPVGWLRKALWWSLRWPWWWVPAGGRWYRRISGTE